MCVWREDRGQRHARLGTQQRQHGSAGLSANLLGEKRRAIHPFLVQAPPPTPAELSGQVLLNTFDVYCCISECLNGSCRKGEGSKARAGHRSGRTHRRRLWPVQVKVEGAISIAWTVRHKTSAARLGHPATCTNRWDGQARRVGVANAATDRRRLDSPLEQECVQEHDRLGRMYGPSWCPQSRAVSSSAGAPAGRQSRRFAR